jgi:hypothetical protein
MSSRTKGRTVRGWDIGLAAAILAVVLLGWLTAPGGSGAPAHRSGQLVVPVRMSSRAGPGGPVSGTRFVAPRPRGGNGGAAARGGGARR